ncbi:MAG: hypothetical protein HFE97_10535 [Oscillospiraceae bacterium]|nr:hypothetical protein [Oscillospiraceae bacterium]
MGSQALSIYAEEKGDGYHMYLFDGTAWTSQSIDAADMEQYNAKGNLGLYLNSNNDFRESATERIDGKDTVKYTGVIKGDTLQEAIKSFGMMDSLGAMGSMGTTEEQMDVLFSELNDIPISIWIDKQNAYPVKCEMDMTETMNILIQKVLENMGLGIDGLDMNISKMMMTMTYSNFNQAADFTIPAEALAASSFPKKQEWSGEVPNLNPPDAKSCIWGIVLSIKNP